MNGTALGRRVVRTLACATLALPLFASAAVRCEPVAGTLVLTPAPGACTNLGVTVIRLPAPPNGAEVEQCFTVAIQGGLQGTGVAGVYSQAVLSKDGLVTTPLVVGIPTSTAARTVLTAKSMLTVRGGTLESQEIILMTPPSEANLAGEVVEQALLLNGTGRYRGATGSLAIIGNSIGQTAPYVGRVCTTTP